MSNDNRGLMHRIRTAAENLDVFSFINAATLYYSQSGRTCPDEMLQLLVNEKSNEEKKMIMTKIAAEIHNEMVKTAE